MTTDREEIARIIDPDAFRDVEEAYNWALRHTRRAGDWWFAPACESRLVRIQDAYAKADAILARAQGPGEAVAWRYRFRSQWGLSRWSYVDGPERPDLNEWDGFFGESEPLYAATPTREA